MYIAYLKINKIYKNQNQNEKRKKMAIMYIPSTRNFYQWKYRVKPNYETSDSTGSAINNHLPAS